MPRNDFNSPRLYLADDLKAGAAPLATREALNYLRNVLRLEDGASLLVFNGRDGEWQARLVARSKREWRLEMIAESRPQTVCGDLHYAFAPIKHARLDFMIQKAVEMGAGRLSPVITRHTQVARVNVGRMCANVIEAAEQCGILALPQVDEPQDFARWLALVEPGRAVVFCDEAAAQADPLQALRAAPPAPLTLLIGPEGGFDEGERRALLARPNVIRLSLGPRILRADTAAVAALAIVQAARGDWR